MEAFLPGGGGSRLFLHSPGSDGALTRIAGRSGLTFGADASPDGRWLAYGLPYVEGNGGRVELFLLTPGEEAIHVATDGDFSRTPAFSPDGRSLAYASGSSEDLDLFLYTMDNGANRVLVDDAGRAFHPAWSPDGRRLAFSSYDGDAELYMLDVATGVVTPLSDNEAHDDAPDWSPAGGQLAFLGPRRRPGLVRPRSGLGTGPSPHGHGWQRDGAPLVPRRAEARVSHPSTTTDGTRSTRSTPAAERRDPSPTTHCPSSPSAGSAAWTPAFETGLRSSLFADDALVEAPSDWRPGGRRPNPSATGSPMCRRCCSCPLQRLILTGNPLSRESLDIHVPAMRAQGTLVSL